MHIMKRAQGTPKGLFQMHDFMFQGFRGNNKQKWMFKDETLLQLGCSDCLFLLPYLFSFLCFKHTCRKENKKLFWISAIVSLRWFNTTLCTNGVWFIVMSTLGCTRLHNLVHCKKPLGIILVESRGHECRFPASPEAKTRCSDRNQRVSRHRCKPTSNRLLLQLQLVLSSECIFIDQ